MTRLIVSACVLLMLAACASQSGPYASDTAPGFIDCSKGDALTTVPACRSIVRRAIP